MNQMGHEFPNMIGVNAEGVDERNQQLLPDYMTMGQTGGSEAAGEVPEVPQVQDEAKKR